MSPKVWITAYDKFSAILAEESSVDVILIGDSLSMTVYGTDSTQDLPVEILLFHAESVKRYAPNIEIVLDIPYKIAALAKDMEKNSRKILEFLGSVRKMGINNVKIEGSGKDVQNFIRLASDSSLNITGHLGLLPQTAENFRLQGKTPEAEKILLAEVEILKKLKIKYLVLECIPEKLGKKITEKLKKTDIETIGIGAGRYTDGQVLVFDDIVGKFPEKFGKKAKFAKKFCDFYEIGCMAIKNFTQEVREKKYPSILEIYK